MIFTNNSVISFLLVQLVIYFTNRSQIFYINNGTYNSFYILLFICLYPFGFIIGSLFNQFFVNKFGLNGTYIVLFSFCCIALLANNLYESQWNWLLFRFIYSFAIAGLYWIFDDNLLNNPEILKKQLYGVAKVSLIRTANIIASILVTSLFWPYEKMAILSVILLQLAQIFFTFNNKNNNTLAKPINELKFYIDIYFQLYYFNKFFFYFFIISLSIHHTYTIWLILIMKSLQNYYYYTKFSLIVFSLGEIFSSYIFSFENNNIFLKNRLFYGYILFTIINFLLFLSFLSKNYIFLLLLCFLSGILMNKINNDLEYIAFIKQKATNRLNFNFSNYLIKNIVNIIILMVTFHIANYKTYGIFLILSMIYGLFIYLYKSNIINDLNE